MFLFRRVSLYVAIAGVVLMVFLVRKSQSAPAKAEPLVAPAVSPFTNTVAAVGLVESVRENVRIATPVAGLVTGVFVQVGDVVKQGAPLFQIDSRELESQVLQRRADLARVEASLGEMQVLTDDRRTQWERQKRLGRDAVVSADEVERVEFALKAAQAKITTTRAERDVAEAALHVTATALARLTVRAPRDGRVLQVNLRGGEMAPLDPKEPLMVIGEVDRLQVRAEVDEQNAVRVRPGAPATAFLKGSTTNAIALEFVRIEPFVVPKKALTGESTERVDTRVLQVIYRFDRPAFPVYVGQQVDVFIEE
jgi:RND family efflux transporter MFP subunit